MSYIGADEAVPNYGLMGPVKAALEASPLRRGVTLEEIGQCVAFLAGPQASGMTGQTLYVDGGLHAVY